MKVNELDIVNDRCLRGSEKVTVSIVTFGSKPVDVSATVQSVLSQTWQQFEWVIGLADGLNAITIPQTDARIKLQPASQQKGVALNRIIKENKSQYIFFLEWGDVLLATALEKMLLTLSINPELDFVNAYGESEGVIKNELSDSANFLRRNPGVHSFVTRAGIFDNIRFDESINEAHLYWDFWFNAGIHGFWGYTIPEVLYTVDPRQLRNRQKKNIRSTAALTKKYESLVVKGFPSKKLSVFNFDRQVADTSLSGEWVTPVAERSVLFLLPYLEIGGADKFNLDLISGLKQRDWDITIACTLKGGNRWSAAFHKQTNDIFYLDHYANDSVYFKSLYHLVVTRKPAVIFVSQSMYGYHILPYIKKKFPEIAIVDYLHTEAPGWYNGGYPYISTLYQQLLDRTIVSSNHLKEWCIDRGAEANKLEVCYINVDVQAAKRNGNNRQRIRDKWKVADDTRVLLFAGRLTEQKQPLVMLKSIEKLYQRNKNFRCVIIGDGPERKKLLAGIRRSPASPVIRYLGQQENERVMEYMDAADIFFLPSAFEGIALTIYEAMAKSLAIVGADVGGQSELVSSDCGYLVKRSGEEKESGEYAGVLLNLIQDRSLLLSMQNNSRARVVNNFALSEMINGVERIMKNCIQYGSKDPVELAPQYLLQLNRLVFQTHVNDVLWVRSIGRFNTFLKRYRRPLYIARRVYRKLKAIFSS